MGSGDPFEWRIPDDEIGSENTSKLLGEVIIENDDEPDELAVYTNNMRHFTEWIVASGPESFVSLENWR